MKRGNSSSRLKHRLALQQETSVGDGAGGYARAWQHIADLWAEIIPLGSGGKLQSAGSETFAGEQLQAEVSHRLLLRYYPGITAGMRLVFNNRAFNIRWVINTDEKGETLELLVQEGAAA